METVTNGSTDVKVEVITNNGGLTMIGNDEANGTGNQTETGGQQNRKDSADMEQDKDTVDMEQDVDMDGDVIIKVGQTYPDPPDIGYSQMSIGHKFEVIIRIDRPSEKDVKGFLKLNAYGIYREHDLPQGLLLWRFGHTCLIALPICPPEWQAHERVQDFIDGKINAFYLVMLDENGIVRAVVQSKLDSDAIDLLKEIWMDTCIDRSDSHAKFDDFLSRNSIDEVWKKARKWKAFDTAVESPPVINACGKCNAAGAMVTRLNKALEKSIAAEAEQQKRIVGLIGQISSFGRAIAAIEEKFHALSTESLQQEVAGLKAVIEGRDYRILELEEQAQDGDRRIKTLEGEIDDLTRRDRHLTVLLRKHGTSPDGDWEQDVGDHKKAA